MNLEKLRKAGEVIKLKRIIIFVLAFIFIYFIIMTSLMTKKYTLSAGEIAKVDIKATKEITDEVQTQAKIDQAIAGVGLQYNKRPEVKVIALENIKALFSKINFVKDRAMDDKEKLNSMKSEAVVSLSDDEYSALLKLTKEELESLRIILNDTFNDLYEKNTIDEGKPEDITRAQELVKLTINSTKLSKDSKEVGIGVANRLVKPNFFFDKEKTNEMQKDEEKKITPVIIKKDQIVVREGESVTPNQIIILNDLGLLSNNSSFQWYIYLSLGVLVFTILFLQWVYIYRYYKLLFDSNSKMALISILNCIALLLARTLSLISPYLIPLACIPMLMTLLINYKISITVSLINVILISSVVGFNIEITLIAVLNAVLGAMILRKLQARNDILYSSIYISIINMIITFCIGVLLSNDIFGIVKKAAFSGIGGFISAILTIGLLPFFESGFDIVTVIKLLELSNPNNVLLKRLLIEAPGTYHHSILVANLAEVAAEAVGGNPVLARVGSYYHDVGKIKRPYFFKENQMENDNPHDKITPSLSTLIITSHVKDGLELAKEAKIPLVIREIIEEHHGNSLVKFFYYTMRNNADNPSDIKEEDFRYSGPLPKSKEAGIIMLADGVEAAVRSITNPTQDKIEEMVNNIVKDRINDGQLKDCNLTLRDLEYVRKALFKSLTGIYHHRIEYPTERN